MSDEVIGRGLVEVLPDFRKFGQQLAASMRTARAQLDGSAAGLRASATTVFGSMAKVGKGVSLIGVGAAVASVKMAGDFQAETAVLQTAAGETAKGLGTVRKGILSISQGTGTGIKNLTDGMYTIEKAGFRGKAGLDVLRAAAQGAKEENASLADVTNAMTSVMASYHLKTTDSVRVMNALKTAAGEGKITMEEFSGALSTVLPIASANKISLEEVGGAVATLTQHGTSAREATQELAATIRSLAAPNNVAAREMARFGLSSVDVSQNLGKRGLSGTIDLLTHSILSKMGPSGKVLLSAFEGTKQSAQNAQIMISKMPPALAETAKSYLAGKMNAQDWNKVMKGVPGSQAPMLRTFKTLVDRSNGFSRELKSGGPAAKTYTDALKKMTGGAIGLNTVLQLSGESTDGYKERIKKVGESFHNSSKDVEGWKVTQGLFNTQLARMKQTLQVLLIQLGTKLIPIIQKVVFWLGKNKNIVLVLAGLIGGILTLSVVAFAARTVASGVSVVRSFVGMGVSAVRMGMDFTAGFRDSQAAASRFTGVAGTIGGRVRAGLSAATSGISSLGRSVRQMSTDFTAGFRSAQAAESGFTGMSGTLGGKIRSGLTSMGQAASSFAGSVKAAALATRDFARAQLESAVANTRAAIAWTVAKAKTLAQAAATGVATAAQWLWNAAMDANPITLMVIAIGALVAAIVFVAVKTTWFQTAWTASWGAVTGAFWAAFNFITEHWRTLLTILAGPVGLATVYIIDHWKQISSGFSSMIGWIRQHWVAIVSIITGPIGTVTLYVLRHWNEIIDGAKSMIRSLASWFSGLPGRVSAAVGNLSKLLYGRGRDVINGLLNGARDIASGLSGWMSRNVKNPITGAFFRSWNWLYGKGKDVINGLFDGLKAPWKALTGWVGGVAKWIKDHKGPISLDRKLLRPAGVALMQGLLSGLKFGFKGVGNFIYHTGSKISDVTSSILSNVGGFLQGGNPNASMSSTMKIGQQIMARMGFQGAEWPALRQLWINESGWRTNAMNASSGAYGIPQALPASKMASAGADWRTNPATQIEWGLNYIRQRYGTPRYALSAWESRSPHWYDSGGWLPPGLSLAMNGTGKPERIRTAGQEASLGSGTTINLTVVNHGVIGSKQQAMDFLVDALDTLGRQHRLPRSVTGG